MTARASCHRARKRGRSQPHLTAGFPRRSGEQIGQPYPEAATQGPSVIEGDAAALTLDEAQHKDRTEVVTTTIGDANPA